MKPWAIILTAFATLAVAAVASGTAPVGPPTSAHASNSGHRATLFPARTPASVLRLYKQLAAQNNRLVTKNRALQFQLKNAVDATLALCAEAKALQDMYWSAQGRLSEANETIWKLTHPDEPYLWFPWGYDDVMEPHAWDGFCDLGMSSPPVATGPAVAAAAAASDAGIQTSPAARKPPSEPPVALPRPPVPPSPEVSGPRSKPHTPV